MQPRDSKHPVGCDVSHYQGVIDWPQVYAAGYEFALCKATEGHTMIDDTFADNMAGAKAAGLAVGCYHFFRAASVTEAQQEASAFLSVLDSIGGIDALDIPPILDVETNQGLDPGQLVACVLEWLEAVEQHTGVRPLIYSYPAFIEHYLHVEALGSYGLQYAYYNEGQPADRGPWKEWTILQYTDRGEVPGISGPVDLNELNGGVDMFLNKMNEKIARELIEVCKAHYMLAASQQDKDAWHERAEEIRKVSGLPPDR